MNKTVLITGATSGIGEACAHQFAVAGYNIIITGRRQQQLTALQQLITSKYHVMCIDLCFDVQHNEQVTAAIASLPVAWRSIHVLINNAGLALGRAYFDDADMADWEVMINTNVKGLLYVSKAVIPYMIQSGHGHIINIGSVAGKEVYEKGNVYCATKHAVDAITKAQRIDLVRHGIKVTAIHPGAAETEFSVVRFKGDTATASTIYNGWQPLQAADVAQVIYYTTTLPSHVCINDIVLTSTQQANATIIHKG